MTRGGLPAGRSTLVAGPAGSGKTLLGLHFIIEGARRYDEPGVIVTFEESPAALARHAESFNWPLGALAAEGRVAFVDVSPSPGEVHVEAGEFDFAALQARIRYAVGKVGARRLLLDAMGTLFSQFRDAGAVRRELFRVLASLRDSGVTTLVTAERALEKGPIARHGVEEFVVDNVIVLRNTSKAGRRRRTLEVLKLRGCDHDKGDAPFVIDARGGVTVLAAPLDRPRAAPDRRVTSGIPRLDEMCGGGFFEGSIVVVVGSTGAGKSVILHHFMAATGDDGPGLLVSFDNSQANMVRAARRWGIDLSGAAGGSPIVADARTPEAAPLEEHLLALRRLLVAHRPRRVALDTISALHRVAPVREFRDFTVALVGELRQAGATAMLTANANPRRAVPPGVEALEELSDALVSVRTVEFDGRMHRALAVRKMRGSHHDTSVVEVHVRDEGFEIGEPFKGVRGLLDGTPTFGMDGEQNHYDLMFGPEE